MFIVNSVYNKPHQLKNNPTMHRSSDNSIQGSPAVTSTVFLFKSQKDFSL